MRKLTATEAQNLCELLEERSIDKSSVFTTQLPLAHWSEVVGEPKAAEDFQTGTGDDSGYSNGAHSSPVLKEAILAIGAMRRGKAFVAVSLQDGRRRLVLRSATDLDSKGNPPHSTSRITARSLLPLARHIRCYLTGVNTEELHADRPQVRSRSSTKLAPSPQHTTAPASAEGRITGSPRSARSGDCKNPAAPSHRGLRSC
jgi:hypothetical protein